MTAQLRPTGFVFGASEAWSRALAPLTDLRHGLDLRTGALTTRARLMARLGLSELVNLPSSEDLDDSDAVVVLVNARWLGIGNRSSASDGAEETAAPPGIASVPRGPALGEAWLAGDGPLEGQVLAAGLALNDPTAQAWLASGCVGVPAVSSSKVLLKVRSLDRPWDVLDALPDTLPMDAALLSLPDRCGNLFAAHQWLRRTEDLENAGFPGVHLLGEGGALLGESVNIAPTVVLDARRGPIVLGDGAKVSPLAVLQGPCAVMNGSAVNPHASIRAHTVIGPGCKAGGEISSSVLQENTNKGHDGYLGHGLVGAWCNLGAGTMASNLKNTYGSVRVRQSPGADAVDTGRTFMGPILGDFVRTAIGTRLMTGSVIGTGSMIATSHYAPTCVGPCRFVTDRGDLPHDLDALRTVLQRMLARRDQSLDPELMARLGALGQHESTGTDMKVG